jgi:hypothetical protein
MIARLKAASAFGALALVSRDLGFHFRQALHQVAIDAQMQAIG